MTFEMTSFLDVAIGIVFLLAILSMLVSYANEGLARFMSWRSKTLKEGIANLLSDPDSKALTKLVYAHPLIQSLGRRTSDGGVEGPSYIPSTTFAIALLDALRSTIVTRPASQGATRDGVVLLRQSAAVADSMFRLGDDQISVPPAAASGLVASGRAGGTISPDRLVSGLPKGALHTTLSALAEHAQGDIARFEANIAQWFDDGMDRVSGWYKRRIQKVMFAISLAVVVILNVNVISFSSALWTQPHLRENVVALAQEFQADAFEQGSAATDGDSVKAMSPAPTADEVVAAYHAMEALAGWPLGWTEFSWPAVLVSIPGWLITAILASFGAPFWFNLLGQLLDIRSSGARPEKTKSQAFDASANT